MLETYYGWRTDGRAYSGGEDVELLAWSVVEGLIEDILVDELVEGGGGEASHGGADEGGAEDGGGGGEGADHLDSGTRAKRRMGKWAMISFGLHQD